MGVEKEFVMFKSLLCDAVNGAVARQNKFQTLF